MNPPTRRTPGIDRGLVSTALEGAVRLNGNTERLALWVLRHRCALWLGLERAAERRLVSAYNRLVELELGLDKRP